jgi:processing peptidase subunit alpha
MMTKPDLDQEGIAALGWLTFGADSSVDEYAAGLVYRELVACNINEALANPSGERPAHGLASFYRPYSSAGLVGVTARASPNALPDMVVEASKALPSDLATNLPAAKARALVSFYNAHADSLQDYAAFLATSKWSMEEIAAAIEHISSNGVARANDLARAGKPAMFATGDVMNLPTIKKL